MTTGSNDIAELGELARALLDAVPLVMRAIRAEMRANRNAELSVPQFRVLGYVHEKQTTSLSAIAEHMGLALPSASQMVEGLVLRGFLDRAPDSQDRRKVAIAVTGRGREAWETSWNATRDALVSHLRSLDSEKRDELLRCLGSLRSLFSGQL